jgi:hypothetical protein
VRTLNIRCVYRELYTSHYNGATHGTTGCFESAGVCIACCIRQAHTNKQINEDHPQNALPNDPHQVHRIGKEVKMFVM